MNPIPADLQSPALIVDLPDFMDHFTQALISEALALTGGNRTRAAKMLGISRPTLHAKMEKSGLIAQGDEDE